MSRTRRHLSAAAITALALAACSSSARSASPAPTTVASTTTTVARPASYAATSRVVTFVDKSRKTPAHDSYAGASTRTLRVRVFYPTGGAGPFPFILFSHGFTGTPEAYTGLLTAIAKAGYVIAAPAYPVSNGLAPGGPSPADLANQPKDASFVIDQMLTLNGDASSWAHGLIDPDRIGAGGHSLGAMTTYGLVFNRCCIDSRIKAAVVLSGIEAGFPAAQYFKGITTPLLAIHGDHDETLVYKVGLDAFNHANSPKYMMTMIGGTHSSDELGGTSPGQVALQKAMIDFYNGYLRGDAAALANLRVDGNTAGVTRLIAKP